MELRQTDWLEADLARPSEAVRDARQRLGLSALFGMAEQIQAGPPPAEEPPERPPLGPRLLGTLPLLGVLAVQAVLALRLIWTNTAYQDEALYLWAGHLEIAHLLHGAPIPPFATYFSGAPVLYPPLGALVDNLGGLAAARLLSLAFMLGATALLWRTTARLYSRRTAAYAAALFALLGPTLHLSAFATFDAPAMFLLALAAWLVVRAGRDGDGTGWMVAAAIVAMLANATAYSSAIFDPVLVALAMLTGPRWSDGKEAKRRVAGLLGYLVSLLIVMLTVAGGFYWSGIRDTILDRPSGTDTAMQVLSQAAAWTWLVTLLAALAAAIALGARAAGARRLLPLVLLAAALLAPLAQARIHTVVSLDKHSDLGAWFAAIAAGYLVDVVLCWLRPRAMRVVAALALAAGLAVPALVASQQAAQLFSWPNAAAFVAAFPQYAGSSGRMLVEDPSIGEYYLTSGRQWQRWSNTRSIILPSGRSLKQRAGAADPPAAYQREVASGYFATVALNFMSTPALDQQLAAQLNHSPRYRLVGTIPYGTGEYTIWQLKTMALPPQPGLAGRAQAGQPGQAGQQAQAGRTGQAG